ncbi:MAG TPA: sigma-70 family RNA polymerase sigma factor [Phycisphaerae bacterium]|mgnify:CR=1 FL=1|nr:sigma-70 family RNA polymerase sigma factor [Phycisphaerae bacterium]HOJ75200.1 sigma-70 family RNA polymerase sigma factor [Phycisphaerae bacterium]HOM52449.1 sigma-70 family RNA polymerase sigma factor [Phycisphaerae bacterium]HON67353.1 sigma-70 family RNA polymerase sigma factor [Phycisphaerae bacterium]HOQ86567.1 sigma-70 family RNA polymerase sigma factor [Phycisphaerae bacterium]
MSEAVRQVEGLYQAYGPALLVYLRRLAGRRELAEDLLQETFVQALRGVDRLDEVVSPRAWLFTIARNVGISALRRRRPVAALAEDVPAAEVAGADPRLERMAQAIDKLPDKLRETLELRLRHELSYEEIAAVLSIPVGTVRSRLHHAVRQLRDELAKDEDAHAT